MGAKVQGKRAGEDDRENAAGAATPLEVDASAEDPRPRREPPGKPTSRGGTGIGRDLDH